MKKVTAFFMAVILMLSTLAFTVSAKDNQLTTGESIEVNLSEDEEIIYTFTPKQAGNYKITVAGVSKAVVTAEVFRKNHPDKILDEGFIVLADNGSSFGSIFKNIVAGLDAGETELMYMNAKTGKEISIRLTDMTSFVLGVWNEFGPTFANDLIRAVSPSTVRVTVEAVELKPIKPGHKPHITHEDVFEFVPEATGKYRFTTLSDGAVPEITICDYTGCVASSVEFNTASENTSVDVDLTAELQAGETYLIHCDNTALNEENEAVGSFSIGVEELNSSSITDVIYERSFDTHNNFYVTVQGRPAMIQFIEPDGGTRTYDRSHRNVDMKSYNADGEEVNSLDRTVAYEKWNIYSNMSVGVNINVRAKFLEGVSYRWDNSSYSFTVELAEKTVDAEVRSITPSAVSGGTGAVITKVITGPDAQGMRFLMPDGTTATYYSSRAAVLDHGDLEFTGKAWMNEKGINTITVLVRSENQWNKVGTIEYTAE